MGFPFVWLQSWGSLVFEGGCGLKSVVSKMS